MIESSIADTSPRGRELRASYVDHQIGDQLPGAVIRHLPTAIGLHDFDVAWRQQVLRAPGLALREYRFVFGEP